MALKIYGIARTRAFRVLWAAKEAGIAYEHLPIEIQGANPETEAYLKLNPNGRLPTIDDDGFILWESLAVTTYLAKKHATGTLYPATIQGEARVWQWSLWAANEVERAVNIWSLHAYRLPPDERDPEKLADTLRIIEKPFRVLNGALAGRQWLIADNFTVADLNVAAVIGRAVDMDLTENPNIAAWLRRCYDRPAAKDAKRMQREADEATPPEITRMIRARNRL
jgi:glutathione S-transferase